MSGLTYGYKGRGMARTPLCKFPTARFTHHKLANSRRTVAQFASVCPGIFAFANNSLVLSVANGSIIFLVSAGMPYFQRLAVPRIRSRQYLARADRQIGK